MHWALIIILGLEVTPVQQFQSEELCKAAAEQVIEVLKEQKTGRDHTYVCVKTSN